LFNSPKHLGVAYTSEIEKLEKRWAENPKGRNFAPLADAYRKAGELDRALELCTAGLELHPDYVSAHIVFGRCLIDQKNEAGASDVFRKVLALDPENVLALKILAEIADRGGRYDEAAEWLGRLLAADPMNGDAAEALTRARSRAAQTAAKQAPAAEPVARLVPEPPAPQRDLVIEHASEEPTSPSLDVKGTPADIETFDGTLDFNAVAHRAAKADGIEVQEEVELKPRTWWSRAGPDAIRDRVLRYATRHGRAGRRADNRSAADHAGRGARSRAPRFRRRGTPGAAIRRGGRWVRRRSTAGGGRAVGRRWRGGRGRARGRRTGAHRDDG